MQWFACGWMRVRTIIERWKMPSDILRRGAKLLLFICLFMIHIHQRHRSMFPSKASSANHYILCTSILHFPLTCLTTNLSTSYLSFAPSIPSRDCRSTAAQQKELAKPSRLTECHININQLWNSPMCVRAHRPELKRMRTRARPRAYLTWTRHRSHRFVIINISSFHHLLAHTQRQTNKHTLTHFNILITSRKSRSLEVFCFVYII